MPRSHSARESEGCCDSAERNAVSASLARPVSSSTRPRPNSAAGEAGAAGHGLLDAAQMKHWFEDLRAELVRRHVAYPATLAAMGYSGIGIGGDTAPQGFAMVGTDEREPWEPLPAGDAA